VLVFANIMQQKMRIITRIEILVEKQFDCALCTRCMPMFFLEGVKEFRSFDPPRETKIGLKHRVVRESEVKLQCSTELRETTFGSSYLEVKKIKGSRNREFTVLFSFSLKKLPLGTVCYTYTFRMKCHAFNLFST